MNNPFLKAPKKPIDPARAEYNAQPASKKLDVKALIWSLVVILLLPLPGIISAILVICAVFVKTRGTEERLIYVSKSLNMVFTVFGIAYNVLGILQLFA